MTKTKTLKNQKFLIFSIKRNFNGLLFSIIILFTMGLIISKPAIFSASTISGLKLFIHSVLPGLFPFMFLTKLLTELGVIFKITRKCSKVSNNLFGTPGVSLYCFFMSILSGYPIGAKIICDLYNKNLISEEDANRMSLFCTTSGPIFVIGAVGVGMLSSFKIGVILYIAHILASIILGISYNLIFKSKNQHQTKIVFTSQSKDNLIASVLNDTINSLFMVGGFITIFYLATEALSVLKIADFSANILSKIFAFLNISKQEFTGAIYGLFEVTHGVKDLSMLHSANIPLICGLISFSGTSIIMQSLSFLKQAKIKTHTFILSKCVLMIMSMLICKGLILLC